MSDTEDPIETISESTRRTLQHQADRIRELLASLAAADRMAEALDDASTWLLVPSDTYPQHHRELERVRVAAREALAAWRAETCPSCKPGGTHDIHFDRTLCACGSMHYYCNECGRQTDPCDDRAV